MTPTRELAKQVSDTFEMICNPLTVLCVYGGTPIIPQGNENSSSFINNIAVSPASDLKENFVSVWDALFKENLVCQFIASVKLTGSVEIRTKVQL